MRFAPAFFVLALATSTLAGCSSSEPREATTVHCMKCHRSVSTESVVCTDCAAPVSDPVIVDRDPSPTDTTPPPVRPAQPRKTPPPSTTTPVADNGARRAPTAKDSWSIFLNKFAQEESDAVEAELLRMPDFVDVTPGGGAAGRRVVIQCKYVGANLKRDLVAVMRKLGYRFTFTEAKLQDQIELVKE